jgi:hypothetical protein
MSEPVAWRVYDTDGSEAVFVSDEMAKAAAYEWNWSIEPLYRSPTLTDAEREAILWCVEMAETTAAECDEELAALRGLLARFE